MRKPPAGLLLDLDGTVYEDEAAIPGVPTAIAKLRDAGVPVRFVTNTTRVPRSTIAGWLADFDVPAQADDVFTPPLAAVGWLKTHGLRRLAVCLPEHAQGEFADFEIVAEDQRPEAVVVGDLAAGWTFDVMNRVFRWLLDGVEFVALHRNRYWKSEGKLLLDVGAFVAAFEYATGRQATLVGKPSRAMFQAAAASMGLTPADVAMVGDDLQADIAGAQAVGCQAFLVRTGKFRAAELGASGIEPDLLVDSLAALPDLLLG
jgi:HAD superfamily hydrolase (TIGR01458 family)